MQDYICEHCKNKHDGTFGKGRFCSQKCVSKKANSVQRRVGIKSVADSEKHALRVRIPVGYEDVVIEAISKTDTMSAAAKYCGMHYLTFRKYAKRLGLWQPTRLPIKRAVITTESILSGAHQGLLWHCHKRKLLKEGILTNKCDECGIHEWLNKPLVCELDHIDGNAYNNKRENLRMLCPNCHSQTPTFRGKNRKNKGWHE
jgi:hypothetical protein